MSNLPYKNPISPIQLLGSQTVSRTDTFGTNFSVLSTGGYMEVYNLSDLDFTIPVGQTGTIEFSGNVIPIQFKKGSGSVFSPDVLTLNSDNISSGRRRLGMLAYVYETNTIYRYTIDNYDSLWSAATSSSGPGGQTVIISDFGTTIKNNSVAGQNLINAWTASTIEGVSGFTSLNARWRVLNTGSSSGGTATGDYLPLSGGTVTGGTIFQSGLTANTISATTYQNLPNTLYTGDGTLLSNRVVNLSSYTLNFSSSTNANTLVLSGGNVGINTTTPLYKLDVNGDTRLGRDINKILFGNYIQFDYSATGYSNYSRLINQTPLIIGGITNYSDTVRPYITLGVVGGNNMVNNTILIRNSFGDLSQISGTVINTQIAGRIGSASGNPTHTYLNIIPQYDGNPVGNTYTGTIRGVYYNPFYSTSFPSGATNIAWENTVGNVLLGTTSGNVGVGVSSPSNKLHLSASTDPLRIEGLSANTSDTRLLSIDSTGVVHTFPLTGITGTSTTSTGQFLPLSGGTVTGNTVFQSGLTGNTMYLNNNLYLNNLSSPSYLYMYDAVLLSYSYISPIESGFSFGTTFNNEGFFRTQLADISGITEITLGYISSGTSVTLSNFLTDSNRLIFLPNNDGIFALSVNNVSADTSGNIVLPLNYLYLSGGTVTGGTNFTDGLTAATISATTYLNYPDTFVTGFTLTANTITLTQNRTDQYSSFTISLSAYTGSSSTSGAYLPLSGGTLTGGLVANSGVTANTISQTQYIDFTTGTTNPSSVAGRLFFDNTQKALSYFDIDNNQVPIAMGQQLYTRVWNASGVQIDKGKVIAITGTSNNLPSAILARNVHTAGSDRPIGLASENIPNGSEGLVLNNGILSGITLNTFSIGDTLYLSDTIPGGYVASTASLAFTARTNEIGYVLETGVTTGKIYVNINNEDSNLSLTDKERNILEGNVVSTGVYEYTGMTSASTTTVNIAPIRGWIVKNTYEFATLPDVTNLYYTGGTGITITNISSADATYVLINSASTIYQQTTFPTPQQRRENIFLGKVVHPNRTSILAVNNTVDFDVSPMSALRDLWTPLKLINEGIVPSANGANLSINTSAGTLWGNGIGWVTNQLNPDSVTISGKSPASFFYRTQTGGTSGAVSVIDPTKYDVGGVITSVGGAGSDDATNQRIYMYPTGIINILYGQQRYNNLAAAIAGIQSETFITYPNASSTGILIGILSVRNDIVADGEPLTNTNYAKFTFVSKFGELLGGTGGISTTTLQQAYDNSSTPEIVTNSAEGALSIQNGTGNADNVTNLFEGKASSSGTTSFIRADGLISGSSVAAVSISATTISATTYENVNAVTGGSYSNGTITLSGTGNVNGNTITGLSTGGSFTGGTVNGATNFTDGLSGNTILAGSGSISSSAALEVSSTTKGFLPPRMTESQRNSISTPATGLMVYQTDGDEGLYIYKSFGWVQII